MKNSVIADKFYNKLDEEFNSFKDYIKGKTPDEMLRFAYEYVMKLEIYERLSTKENLEKSEMRELLKSENIINDLYDFYLDSNYSLNMIWDDTINDYIDYVMDDYDKPDNKRISTREAR